MSKKIDHSKRVYEEIGELLSNEDNPTPLVKLNTIPELKNVKIYGKLEWYNPFGAVKDRVAANLLSSSFVENFLNRLKYSMVFYYSFQYHYFFYLMLQ